ncbi:MAG: two-component regulator propeller domain-containing protein [Prevotellaceae bacterium]|nr:two-component regulator propeller domain-containing protein [Prevotellaceae bacterium]
MADTGQEFSFRHYSDYDGLWRNAIRALAQDKHGFIWIGSDVSLKRFDGISMRSFKTSDDKSVLAVYALLDMGDSLMVGTDDGAFVLDYRTELTHKLHLVPVKGRPDNIHVTSMAVDRDNNVWISTMWHGVYLFSTDNGTLRHIDVNADNRISQVYVDSSNQIWALSPWGSHPGLYLYDKSALKFSLYRLNGKWSESAFCMMEAGDGTRWFGTWNEGLVSLDANGNVNTYLGPGHKDYALHIHSIAQYAPGIILVGCDNGMVQLDLSSNTSHTYSKQSGNTNTISGSFVYPILTDSEGGIWVGTFYSGLNYVSPSYGRFKSYFAKKNENSVRGNIINRFCEDRDRNIWIASDDGGLNKFTPSTGHFEHIALGNGSISDNNIHALCADGDKLWIGSYTAGVYVMDLKSGKCRQYVKTASQRSLYGNSCYAICRDSQGSIWIATTEGICIYCPDTDDFQRVKPLDTMIMGIVDDEKGHLWFASQADGVLRFDRATGRWKSYNNGRSRYSIVNCIYMDENSKLWAATDDGLLRYDDGADRFTRVETIADVCVCGIVENNGSLWLTCNEGLYKYTEGKPLVHFDVNDGLQSNLFLPNATFKASDGCIYLGTVNGFNTFYPYQIKPNTKAPRVMITQVRVMDQMVQVGDDRLDESLNTAESIHLSYQDKMLSISFASLSYCAPQKNRYSYMLEGFDRRWIMAGNRSTATYTNLSPGTYTFKVKGTNNDGLWSTEETTLRIVVHPPFYWSLPAKLLYLVVAVVLLAYAFRYTLGRERRRHDLAMSKLNEEKELEVRNSKIRFFTTIAHEIRTPVSLIIGPLEKLVKTSAPLSATERNSLNIIDRNAHRLLELVNQLLDFSKVENQSLSMRFQVCNVSDMLRSVCERFEPTFAQGGITFRVDYPDSHFTAIIDRESITKVVSNLLTNARKYTRDRVSLSCQVMPDDTNFAIEVTDNGVGIDPNDHERIFQAFYQSADNKPGTGIGLSIVKNIVDQHNGTISVESQPGHGATFTVLLPVKQEMKLEGRGEKLEGRGEKVEGREYPTASNQGSDISLPSTHYPLPSKSSPLPSNTSPLPSNTSPLPTVLIVDDNNDMLSYLEQNMSEKHRVVTAHDGLEALDKLASNDVSLIICDWMMPRMDGAEFCRRVRSDAATSHIPLVMLTAKTDTISKVEGMNIGADAYIEKPFSIDYLEACCNSILSMRERLREKYSRGMMEPIERIAPTDVDKEFLEKMQLLIEENLSNPELSVNFLAQQLCISRSHFFAKIKTLADVSPNEMIQLVRLKKAAQLLAEGNMKVSDVCYSVGFSNSSYFAKCFYKQFGVRPADVKGISKSS